MNEFKLYFILMIIMMAVMIIVSCIIKSFSYKYIMYF